MRLRILSYNVRFGGLGRERSLATVIRTAAPDLVLFQEANRPHVVETLAKETGMTRWASSPTHSVAFMTRLDVSHHDWHRPPACRRAFLEIVLAATEARVFGVHLTAVHSNWSERRRARELRALLHAIERHQHGSHLIGGDFNTLAPGEKLDLRRLPPHLRLLALLSGRTIRWHTIQIMLDAEYIDGFRRLHPDVPGYTFPTWDPHVRLDYVFVPRGASERLHSVEIVDGPDARAASDHLPLLAVVDL